MLSETFFWRNWRTAAGWCPCGSSYQFRNSHYLRDVVQDAGGRLLTMPAQEATGCEFLTNTDGSQTYRCDAAVAKDHVLELLGNADVIMDSTSSPLGYLQAYTLDDFISSYQVPADMQLKAMTGAKVFREDGAINDAREGVQGSARFEQMFAQPQEYVNDMGSMGAAQWDTSAVCMHNSPVMKWNIQIARCSTRAITTIALPFMTFYMKCRCVPLNSQRIQQKIISLLLWVWVWEFLWVFCW